MEKKKKKGLTGLRYVHVRERVNDKLAGILVEFCIFQYSVPSRIGFLNKRHSRKSGISKALSFWKTLPRLGLVGLSSCNRHFMTKS